MAVFLLRLVRSLTGRRPRFEWMPTAVRWYGAMESNQEVSRSMP